MIEHVDKFMKHKWVTCCVVDINGISAFDLLVLDIMEEIACKRARTNVSVVPELLAEQQSITKGTSVIIEDLCVTQEPLVLTEKICVTEETNVVADHHCVTQNQSVLTEQLCVTEETTVVAEDHCVTQDQSVFTEQMCVTEETTVVAEDHCVTQDQSVFTEQRCVTEETTVVAEDHCVTQEQSVLTEKICVTEETPVVTEEHFVAPEEFGMKEQFDSDKDLQKKMYHDEHDLHYDSTTNCAPGFITHCENTTARLMYKEVAENNWTPVSTLIDHLSQAAVVTAVVTNQMNRPILNDSDQLLDSAAEGDRRQGGRCAELAEGRQHVDTVQAKVTAMSAIAITTSTNMKNISDHQQSPEQKGKAVLMRSDYATANLPVANVTISTSYCAESKQLPSGQLFDAPVVIDEHYATGINVKSLETAQFGLSTADIEDKQTHDELVHPISKAESRCLSVDDGQHGIHTKQLVPVKERVEVAGQELHTDIAVSERSNGASGDSEELFGDSQDCHAHQFSSQSGNNKSGAKLMVQHFVDICNDFKSKYEYTPEIDNEFVQKQRQLISTNNELVLDSQTKTMTDDQLEPNDEAATGETIGTDNERVPMDQITVGASSQVVPTGQLMTGEDNDLEANDSSVTGTDDALESSDALKTGADSERSPKDRLMTQTDNELVSNDLAGRNSELQSNDQHVTEICTELEGNDQLLKRTDNTFVSDGNTCQSNNQVMPRPINEPQPKEQLVAKIDEFVRKDQQLSGQDSTQSECSAPPINSRCREGHHLKTICGPTVNAYCEDTAQHDVMSRGTTENEQHKLSMISVDTTSDSVKEAAGRIGQEKTKIGVHTMTFGFHESCTVEVLDDPANSAIASFVRCHGDIDTEIARVEGNCVVDLDCSCISDVIHGENVQQLTNAVGDVSVFNQNNASDTANETIAFADDQIVGGDIDCLPACGQQQITDAGHGGLLVERANVDNGFRDCKVDVDHHENRNNANTLCDRSTVWQQKDTGVTAEYHMQTVVKCVTNEEIFTSKDLFVNSCDVDTIDIKSEVASLLTDEKTDETPNQVVQKMSCVEFDKDVDICSSWNSKGSLCQNNCHLDVVLMKEKCNTSDNIVLTLGEDAAKETASLDLGLEITDRIENFGNEMPMVCHTDAEIARTCDTLDGYTQIKSATDKVVPTASKNSVHFASPLTSYVEYSYGESSSGSEDTQDALETLLYLSCHSHGSDANGATAMGDTIQITSFTTLSGDVASKTTEYANQPVLQPDLKTTHIVGNEQRIGAFPNPTDCPEQKVTNGQCAMQRKLADPDRIPTVETKSETEHAGNDACVPDMCPGVMNVEQAPLDAYSTSEQTVPLQNTLIGSSCGTLVSTAVEIVDPILRDLLDSCPLTESCCTQVEDLVAVALELPVGERENGTNELDDAVSREDGQICNLELVKCSTKEKEKSVEDSERYASAKSIDVATLADICRVNNGSTRSDTPRAVTGKRNTSDVDSNVGLKKMRLSEEVGDVVDDQMVPEEERAHRTVEHESLLYDGCDACAEGKHAYAVYCIGIACVSLLLPNRYSCAEGKHAYAVYCIACVSLLLPNRYSFVLFFR